MYGKIRIELQYPIDKHSRSLIVDNIKLLLDYCIRFYDRQFITRDNANHDLLARFEDLLDEYFASDAPARHGGCRLCNIVHTNFVFPRIISVT